jgi:hypothetical protein
MDKQHSLKKRVACMCYPFFIVSNILIASIIFIALTVLFTTSAFAADILFDDIEEIRNIAKNGAVSLALKSIEEQQPLLDIASPDVWLKWERERLMIYQSGQRWQVLQERVGHYKDGLPDDFFYWAKQQQVNALLTLNQAQQARNILQTLIWSEKSNSEKQQLKLQWLPLWQKKIIESYLLSGESNDALLAAQRYYQDYPANDLEDRLLRARIYLINNREEDVVKLLKNDTKHPLGGMLYLLAQLRSGITPAPKVLETARNKMSNKKINNELKFMLWAVVAESAKRSGDRAATINALEFLLAGNKNIDLPVGVFDFSADSLWDIYIDYAIDLGNREQYLIGNDKQWLDAAVIAEKKSPIKARSLYAMVIIRSQNEGAKLQAAKGFLNLMHKRKRGAELIMKLFLKSENFTNINQIPSPIRYDIVNVALSRSNIELASNLMATIQTAPAGIDDFQWQLQRARILVLGGKIDKGGEALTALIEKNKTLERQHLERFIQVLFDLQTVKEHALAYLLFQAVLPKTADEKLQREIYFWMADSLKAQQQYTSAAKFYLRSATHAGNIGFDPWGQTARYQAAEMLTKAALLKDAHALYTGLLAVTKEPERRAVLNHELQKLWLLREPGDHDDKEIIE